MTPRFSERYFNQYLQPILDKYGLTKESFSGRKMSAMTDKEIECLENLFEGRGPIMTRNQFLKVFKIGTNKLNLSKRRA